jgi:uncharacterized protein YjeT (DUF2065 family)
MSDVIAAIGLVLVLEGALYALFPNAMKRLAAQALDTPGETLRLAGLVSAALGVGVVWLVRG